MESFEVQVDPDLAKVLGKICRAYASREEWDQASMLARLESAILPD